MYNIPRAVVVDPRITNIVRIKKEIKPHEKNIK